MMNSGARYVPQMFFCPSMFLHVLATSFYRSNRYAHTLLAASASSGARIFP
jgi:hypothetical protein